MPRTAATMKRKFATTVMIPMEQEPIKTVKKQRQQSVKQVTYKNFTLSPDRTRMTIQQVTIRRNSNTEQELLSPLNDSNCKIEKIKNITLNLVEITPAEIAKARRDHVPFFVLKENGKYYFTEVPIDLNFLSADLLGEHLCAKTHTVCQRLDPVPFKEGGCQKVCDHIKMIERYPFIETAYEVSNTRQEVFTVVKCKYHRDA